MARQAQTKSAPRAQQTAERVQPAFSAVGIGAAALLAAACAIPFFVWDKAYPPEILKYWGIGTLLAAGTAGVVCFAPLHAVHRVGESVAKKFYAINASRFAAAIALLTATLAVFFSWYASGFSGSTTDEFAQLWGARILLHGRLFLPADPNPEFFSLDTVVDGSRWYAQFPIGGPAMLALGLAVHAAWLVNCLCAAVALVAFYHFARTALDEQVGRAAAALLSITPLFLLLAGTMMNHAAALMFASCALAALAEWHAAEESPRRILLAGCVGLCLGALVCIRPYDGAIAIAIIGVFQLRELRNGKVRFTELLAAAGGGMIALLPLLFANASTTGSPLTFGYEVQWGAAHRPGFHVDPHGVLHTPARALEYAITYLAGLNTNLLDWPVPALLVVIVSLCVMRPFSKWDALLLGWSAAHLIAYACYWFDGQLLGPRFLYPLIPFVILYIVRGPVSLGLQFGARWKRFGMYSIVLCAAASWCVPTAFSTWGIAAQARSSRSLLKVDFGAATREANLHNALIFLREPLRAQLERRLWGLGISRSSAAQLIPRSDGCSLLSAIQAAESAPVEQRAEAVRRLIGAVTPLVAGNRSVSIEASEVQLNVLESVDAACGRELEGDAKLPRGVFGTVLPLEPINEHGQIDGDVIYVADLGMHNEVLRKRFGTRKWYRMGVMRDAKGVQFVAVSPY